MVLRATLTRTVLVVGLAAAALLTAPQGAGAMFTGLERVVKASAQDSAPDKQATVTCPVGKRVVGAGADVTPGFGDVLIDAIRPDPGLTSVTVHARLDASATSDWFVAAWAVCAAPPAGLERVAATSASSSAAKSAVATCPSGKRLLGSAAEIGSPNGQVLLDGIVPNLANRNVTVNALEDETGNPNPWTVTAYAICSSPVAGLVRVSATSPLDSDTNKVVHAPCPAGKQLISMSGTVNSPNGQGVLDALFVDEQVTTAGFAAFEDSTGNASNWSATAYGVCAASARLTTVATNRTTSFGAGVSESCPIGAETLGVGGAVTGAVGQVWLDVLRRDGQDWFFSGATADENGTPAPWLLTAYALCAAPVAGAETVIAHGPSDSRREKLVTVPCPSGKRVLAAGASSSSNGRVRLDLIRPDATLTFVTVRAQEDTIGTDDYWSVTAHAVCAPPPAGLQRVAASTPATSEEFATSIAACPAGKHMVGMGAEIAAGLGQVGFDDLRPDAALTRTTVVATEDETGLDADWTATAYAICITR